MSKQKTQFEIAYEQGCAANEDGTPIKENPYTLRGDLRAAWWTQGWLNQQTIRDEWEADNHDRAIWAA